MTVIRYRRIFYILSALLVGASIVLLATSGLRLGIDFTGGALLEGVFEEGRPSLDAIRSSAQSAVPHVEEVRPTGDNGVLLRMGNISEEEHQALVAALEGLGSFREDRFSSIGPTIGEELRRSSMIAIVVALILILGYVAWAFRQASKPAHPFQYGAVALVALFHDVIILLGLFALLGRTMGAVVDTAFVAAVLATVGYSVNDTIVVFDRVRENLRVAPESTFAKTVGKSLREVATRSINTSVTTLIVLFAIFVLGAGTIQPFVLALAAGVIVGTYSSLFLASPLLVSWEEKRSS